MCQSDLRFVFELNRHGVTSPKLAQDFNFDILGQEWDYDFQITNKGLKEQYEKGKELREKYVTKAKLLSKEFKHSDFLTISSDSFTSLTSAYSHVLGMFPEKSKEYLKDIQSITPLQTITVNNVYRILEELDMSSLPSNNQIFPIKAISDKDYFHIYRINSCKPSLALNATAQSRAKVNDFLSNFNNTYFTDLDAMMKFNDKSFLTNYDNVKEIMEAFIIGRRSNLNYDYMGKFVNLDNFHQIAINFLKMDLFNIRLGDEDNFKAKLIVSKVISILNSLLDDIIKSDKERGLERSINDNKLGSSLLTSSKTNESTHEKATKEQFHANKQTLLKYLLYSCTDVEIASLLLFLNQSLNTEVYYPEFSSSIFIEFYKNSNKQINLTEQDYSIKVYFNDKILYEASFSEFKTKTLANTLTQRRIDDFCHYNDRSEILYIMFVSVLAIVCVGLVIWNIILLTKKNS